MEVTSINHLDTHAIVGGAAAQSFAITQNAEFFEVLSSTLYSNKMLAVAREVLCNAWDAHHMVGKTDVPIEVTLSETELVIRDFGPGIAPDKIVDIYCTYGNSTKTHDGKQTGGFGLGSKAPFAYSKHFTVVSCHNGTRSVYAASRGSSETDGRPDMRCMVSVPCGDETGLTVTIPLIETKDRRTFDFLIADLIFTGGILAKFNGNNQPRIDYDRAEMPFVLVSRDRIGHHHERGAGLFVRYGAVVYPVNLADDRMRSVSTRLLSGLTSFAAVVLLAKPNSIGVTPSRESLSYTDKTVATLLELMKEAEGAIEREHDLLSAGIINHAKAPLSALGKKALKYYAGIRHEKNAFEYVRENMRNSSQVFVPQQGSVLRKEIVSLVGRQAASIWNMRMIGEILGEEKIEEARQIFKDHIREYSPKSLRKYFNRIDAQQQRSVRGAYFGLVMNNYHRDTERRFEKFAGYVEAAFSVKMAFGKREYYNAFERIDIEAAAQASLSVNPDPKKALTSYPVIIATSQAAYKRWFEKQRGGIRRSSKDGRKAMIVLRRNSKIEELKAFLQLVGFKDVTDLSNETFDRPALKVSEKFYLLSPTSGAAEEYDGTGATHFVYGTLHERSNGVCFAKIGGVTSSNQYEEALTKKFGKVVLALNAADVRHLTKLGLKNAWRDIAEEIEDLATDDEQALRLSGDYNGFGRLFGNQNDTASLVSRTTKIDILKNLFPSIPFDLIGEIDKPELKELVSLFHMTGTPSKYGFQDIHRALAKVSERVDAIIAPVREHFTSDEMKKSIASFYDYHFARASEPVRDAMFKAAIEATTLQMHLQQIEAR